MCVEKCFIKGMNLHETLKGERLVKMEAGRGKELRVRSKAGNASMSE